MDRVFKQAMAVALGILIAGSIAWAVRVFYAQMILEQLQERAASVLEQAERRRLEQHRLLQEQQRAEELRLQRELAAKKKLRQYQEDRSAAFAEWYQVPTGCGPAGGRDIVACADHKQTARTAFYAEWDEKHKVRLPAEVRQHGSVILSR